MVAAWNDSSAVAASAMFTTVDAPPPPEAGIGVTPATVTVGAG